MAFGKKNRSDPEPPAEETAEPSGEAPKAKTLPDNPYNVGPRPAVPGRELRDWKKRVRRARKILRKELKEKGIRSRADFEQIAWEMGLVIDEKRRGFLWKLWLLGKWLSTHLKLGGLIAAAGLLLATLFLLSYVTDHAGAFTINLTGDMMRAGYVLCEEPTFEEPVGRLASEKTKDVNNITISEIDSDVDEINGPHNGENNVAYTFYVKNGSEETSGYHYALKLRSSSLGVPDAAWIMLFEDGRQVIYANMSADGDPERLIGYEEKPPFYDLAYDADEQYYRQDHEWGIQTTPYASDDVVVHGYVENVEPGEIHKYTVAIWLEGNDPECTDAIFGGHATYSMEFDITNDEVRRSIFNGVWRTEYDDYAEYAAENYGGTTEG